MVGESGGVNGAIGGAVGEVPDGGTGEGGGEEAREAGGTRGTRGAVLEGLVAIGNNVVESRLRNVGLKLAAGGNVHAALGDPASLEAAGSANVHVGDEVIDKKLVSLPAGLGGVGRGQEGVGAPEVVGEDEPEGLADILALSGGIQDGAFGTLDQVAEDIKVEGAGRGNVGVLENDAGGELSGKDRERNELGLQRQMKDEEENQRIHIRESRRAREEGGEF